MDTVELFGGHGINYKKLLYESELMWDGRLCEKG